MKGRPNLTLKQLVRWVKEHHDVEVCTSTMSLCMVTYMTIGFRYKQFSKGVYFDGHERQDVVDERKAYLAELDWYSHRMWVSHSPGPNPLCHPVIRVFHNESTFYSNAEQAFHWTDGSKQALKQEVANMVSDSLGGFLEYNGEKEHLLLEHQTDGSFKDDMLLTQVDKTITTLEKKYPDTQGLFTFDHAPSHMKKPGDSLTAKHMNLRDGEKQPSCCSPRSTKPSPYSRQCGPLWL